MSQAQITTMTVPEFLDWEAKQELRYEFDGFRPIAMTGGTYAHTAININLTTALNIGLRGKRCRPAGQNLKVQIGNSIRKLKAEGFTILLVEQNLRFAGTVADRHYVMERGRIVDEIPNAALQGSMEKVRQYLGV